GGTVAVLSAVPPVMACSADATGSDSLDFSVAMIFAGFWAATGGVLGGLVGVAATPTPGRAAVVGGVLGGCVSPLPGRVCHVPRLCRGRQNIGPRGDHQRSGRRTDWGSSRGCGAKPAPGRTGCEGSSADPRTGKHDPRADHCGTLRGGLTATGPSALQS